MSLRWMKLKKIQLGKELDMKNLVHSKVLLGMEIKIDGEERHTSYINCLQMLRF